MRRTRRVGKNSFFSKTAGGDLRKKDTSSSGVACKDHAQKKETMELTAGKADRQGDDVSIEEKRNVTQYKLKTGRSESLQDVQRCWVKR